MARKREVPLARRPSRPGRTIPIGRMAETFDIADVCVFLASPLARYVSGTSVLAHGGGENPAYLEGSTGEIKG